MRTPYIQISSLIKHFQLGEQSVFALRNVDLDIEQGSFCLIMGQSGSGKSTLLYLLGGLDHPTAGSIMIGGQSIEELNENELARFRRQKMGFVFQSFNLLPSMTALENVSFPMTFAQVPKKQRQDKAREALHLVGLDDRIHHRPTELSGGQQQRVAIARALVNDPELILADEPTGNLDSASGEAVIAILKELNQQGVTVVLVTHNPNLVDFARQTVEILDGEIANQHIRDLL